jgi:hypothetical protein
MEEFGLSVAEATTSALNLYLQKVAQTRTTMPELFANDNFGVAIIGYGSEVDSNEPFVYIDSKAVRADEDRTKRDETTISSNKDLPNFPVWLLPAAAGDSRMCAALVSARDALERWLPEHRSAAPPQVINITNGDIGDGDLLEEAQKIKGLSAPNGNVIIWNCQVAATGLVPVLFPRDEDLVSLSQSLGLLSRSSSFIPQGIIRNIFMEFPEVSRVAAARTCVLNANLATLVRMLSCATRLPLP